MGGQKRSYEIELNTDHMGFILDAKNKYNIADEGKVVRIVMDYLITHPEHHDSVFGDARCLRCE